MRIAVYSGSFNPLHIGHLAIMEALSRDPGFDWTYLIVSPQNPLKDASNTLSAKDRYMAAVEAVKRHPDLRVWVDEIELRMPPPQYTIKTLDALRRREPENEFTLVMGADNLAGMHRWRDFQRILSEYGVVVYPREGYDLDSIIASLMDECRRFPAPYVLDPAGLHFNAGTVSLEENFAGMYHIRTIDLPTVDISSTEIRNGISQGQDMSDYLM